MFKSFWWYYIFNSKCENYIQVDMNINGSIGHKEEGKMYNYPKHIQFDNNIGIKDFQCGNGFVLCLTQDNNIYGFGQNNINQLPIGVYNN